MAPRARATPLHPDYFGGDITASAAAGAAAMLATISFKKWSLAASGPPAVKLLKTFFNRSRSVRRE